MTARRLLSLWLPSSTIANATAGARDDATEPLTRLALWCQHYSPLTAIEPPDGILIDITGCAHLFGGETRLIQQIKNRFPGTKLAIAGTALAAWGLARFSETGLETIETLPLSALKLPPHTVTKLRRIGIRRIGELKNLPRAELTAGYGAEPVLRLAQALGEAPEAISFINPPPAWQEIEHYAEPIFTPVQLQAALIRLAGKLCLQLNHAVRGAVEIIAHFYRIDSQRPEICLRFAGPCQDEFHIGKLLVEKLNIIDPGFGIEAISLAAAATEYDPLVQRSIGQTAPVHHRVIDTILNRLGDKNLWRVKPHASHIPERTVQRLPVAAKPVPWTPPAYPRPLHLLAKPAAITAIAPVPDDPPIMFSWRGEAHRIRRASGPERIARDWWAHDDMVMRPETDHIRDYYVVEDINSARFWVFRVGQHGGDFLPRWYLHGFFG